MALVMHFGTPDYLYIKMQNRLLNDKISPLQKDWKSIVGETPLDFFFLDEKLNGMYQKEQNLSKLISWFTFLAVLLACLGLYGLVSFSIVNRLKEVGIRKVLGASLNKILLLLSKQYLYLIVIAISVPLTWYVTNMWLDNFAYRINVDWWIFIVSGLALMLIAGLTISVQTIKAARENPVNVLRNE
jgi:putative ABC transport system permease protein